jgi:hypothetical protein
LATTGFRFSKDPPDSRHKPFRSMPISFQDLAARFHMPLKDVALDLGVCTTFLKVGVFVFFPADLGAEAVPQSGDSAVAVPTGHTPKGAVVPVLGSGAPVGGRTPTGRG